MELAEIKSLIENRVSENKVLEYKSELRIDTDEQKKEFLYDVTSFSNAAGGDIIFGISEGAEKGIPENLSGIESNADELVRKMESLMRDGIVPRILNYNIKVIPLFDKKNIIVVHVPKSINSPHQVTLRGTDKFYSRSNAGKYRLDVHELRNAFLLSDTVIQRIKFFVTDRVGKIVSGEMPVELQGFSKIVMHFLPLSAFDRDYVNISFDVLNNAAILPFGAYGCFPRINLEGLLNFSRPPGYVKCQAYLQLYRNGIMETVNADLLRPFNGKAMLPADGDLSFEFAIVKTAVAYLNFLKKNNVEPPIYCFLTFLDIKGYTIGSTAIHPSIF